MADYKAPVRDMSFVVNEVLKFDALRETLGYEDATADTIDAVFEEAGKLASEVVHPLNQIGDAEDADQHASRDRDPKVSRMRSTSTKRPAGHRCMRPMNSVAWACRILSRFLSTKCSLPPTTPGTCMHR